MAITPLPTPPSRNDAGNFVTRADDFLGALPVFVLQANALADEVEDNADLAQTAAATALAAPGTFSTSATALTIGYGAQALAVQAGKLFVVGQFVAVARTSAPGNWMAGQVTAYDTGTGAMTVQVLALAGAGTFNDWTVSISAPMQFTPATASQILAGLLNTVGLTPANMFAAAAVVQLADAATITPDCSVGYNFSVTLGGNRTIANLINAPIGLMGVIELIQGAGGPYSAAWGSNYKIAGGTPALASAVGGRDLFSYWVRSAGLVQVAWLGGL